MVKKARFGFVMKFVKLWAENSVIVYVREKSCNQTHFLLLILFGKFFFPGFMLSL